MTQVTEIEELLRTLGTRLRAARLTRGDSMAIFAQRLGVSEPTVRAMETGGSTVKIGTWLQALWILNRLEDVQHVLKSRESLIEQARAERLPRRQRAPRRRT